jgi:hypothetical protein
MLKENSNLLNDIIMNAKCYMNISQNCIKLCQQDNKIIYGNENGNLFLILKLVSDMSVFVYEAINFLNFTQLNKFKNKIQTIYGEEYLQNLKLIRNNIHLYNTYGSYKNKADHIISDRLDEFKMKDHNDPLYSLRSDIALIYKIVENKGVFLGTNYFYDHYVYEVNGLNWSGYQIMQYASNTSSIIKFLSNKISNIDVPEIDFKYNNLHMEFFDYKSEELFNNINISYTTAFRLILILTELSYIFILIDDVLQIKDFHKVDTLWAFFLGKYIATKYDEALDSIENMLKYSKNKDCLKEILNNDNSKDTNSHIRKFAHDLRNMIHFGIQDINKKNYIQNLSLLELYLIKTNTDDIEEFIGNCSLMINSMKNLENNIRNIFNLDKSFK